MITIKEVSTKKELKQFILFPYNLYKTSSMFIPYSIVDEMNMFNPIKNDAHKYCLCRQFLCLDDNKVLGRIATIYNNSLNSNTLYFTRFDVEDNIDVTQLLIDKVKEVAFEYSCDEIVGPIGFNDIDYHGILIDGFDKVGTLGSLYNYEYYKDHLESIGFIPQTDWVENVIEIPNEKNFRNEQVKSYTLKKYDLHIHEVKTIDDACVNIKKCFQILSSNTSYRSEKIQLTDIQIDDTLMKLKRNISLDYITFIKDKNDCIQGFGLSFPDLANIFNKFHSYDLSKSKTSRLLNNNNTLEFCCVVVKKEYQNSGIDSLIFEDLISKCQDNSINYIKTKPCLEEVFKNYGFLKRYNVKESKRRRAYKLILPDEE